MTHRLFFLAAAAFILTACADSGCHITQKGPASAPHAESGGVHRGKPSAHMPAIAIENAQQLDETMLTGLRRDFIGRIEGSAWRYTLDSIKFDAPENTPGQWDLIVLLDTGAQVTLKDIIQRDADGRADFTRSYRRMMTALDRLRRQDDALDRYVRYWASR